MDYRRQLFGLIQDVIRRDNPSDYQLARTLNIGRTRASALIHGHIRHFNSETLVDILARLGITIQLSVADTRPYVRAFMDNPRTGWEAPPGAACW